MSSRNAAGEGRFRGKRLRTGPPLSFNAWLRYGLILRALRGLVPRARILEVGVGQGALGTRLARRFSYVGVELDEQAGRLAEERVSAVGGVVFAGQPLSSVEASGFDAVCAFEVLEHIEDDGAALREWTARLRPGGLLVLSVPAGAHRMGPADHRVGHFRRYDAGAARQLLEAQGLVDIYVVHYGLPLGYLLEWVRNRAAARALGGEKRSAKELTAESGRWLQPQGFGALTYLVSLPFRLLQLPFLHRGPGTGLVLTARVRAGE